MIPRPFIGLILPLVVGVGVPFALLEVPQSFVTGIGFFVAIVLFFQLPTCRLMRAFYFGDPLFSRRKALWATGAEGALPMLTLALIAVNLVVFELTWPAVDDYAFDSERPDLWWKSLFVSMFIHEDLGHLTWNMVSLWILGSALEGRVSRAAMLATYVVSSVAGEAVEYLCIWPKPYTSLGASAAIMGLAGLCAVRLQFSTVSLSLFGIAPKLPLVPSVSVPALGYVALGFASDLAGVANRYGSEDDFIAHGAHVGGYLCGVGAAYALGLWRDAIAEVRRGHALSSEECHDGTAITALDAELARSPENVEMLLARARRISFRTRPAAAEQDYRSALRLLALRDRPEAARVFVEYFRKFHTPLGAAEQLALTPSLVAIGQTDLAAQCLESVARTLPAGSELWAQARVREADLLAALDLPEPAAHIYGEVLAACAVGPWRSIAQRGLASFPEPALAAPAIGLRRSAA